MKTKAENFTTFYALNRHNKTAALLHGWNCWEQVQVSFNWGIVLPDGTKADAIGRCASEKQFHSRAAFGEWSVLEYSKDSGSEPDTCTNWNMPINAAWE